MKDTSSPGARRALRLPRVLRVLMGAGLAALPLLAACSASNLAAPGPLTEDAGDAGDAQEEEVEAGRVKGCPGDTPAAYAWQLPFAAEAAACTEADLAKLAALIKERSALAASDIAGALGPSCAACAVGNVTDSAWRAVVAGHEGYIGNVGGCAMLLGAKAACGEAVDRVSTCLIVGCAGCADRKAQDECSDQLTTVDGPCAPALSSMRKECPAAALAAAFASGGACQSFVETIRLFCGPPAQDGG